MLLASMWLLVNFFYLIKFIVLVYLIEIGGWQLWYFNIAILKTTTLSYFRLIFD